MINLCVGGRESRCLVSWMLLGNQRIGERAMMYKACAAFMMPLSVALTLASNQAFGQSSHGVSSASTHSAFHPSVTRSLLHDRRNRAFFPTTGAFFWEPSNGVPNVVTPPIPSPITGDFNYTYKYDVPWDWAHRYPPSFFASPPEPPRPQVAVRPGCAAQTVTVPGIDGKDQTVNIVRC